MTTISKITIAAFLIFSSICSLAMEPIDSVAYWHQRLMSFHAQAKLINAAPAFDSALHSISGKPISVTTAKIYNLGGAMYQAKGQPDQSMALHSKALAIFDSLNHKEGVADTYIQIGKLKWRTGFNQEALNFFQKSLLINEELNRYQAIQNSRYWIANVYLQFDQLDLALKHFIAATDLIENYENEEHINTARLYRGLARVYVEAAYLDEAKKYINKSMHLSKHYNNQLALAADYSIMGSIHYANKNYDSAIYYHKACLKVYQDKNQLEWMAQSNMSLTRAYFVNNETDSTDKYLNKALTIYNRIQSQSGIAHALLLKGHILSNKQQYAEAIESYKASLATFQDSSRPTIVQSNYRGLAEAYGRLHQVDSAYFYLKQFHQGQNATSAKKEERNLALFTEQLNMAQKNRELAYQALEKERLEASIFKRNTYLVGVSCAFVCLFVFGYNFFRRYQVNQENKQLILEREHQKNTLALKNAQLRTKIYSNISHEFKTPLMLILSPIERLLQESNEENRIILKILQRNALNLKQMVDQLLDMNSAKSGLLSLHCQLVDLGSELRSMVKGFKPVFENKKLKVSVKIPDQFIDLNIDRDKFEKIFNNLLSNAIKHTAEGGQVKIALRYEEKPFSETVAILDVFNSGARIPADQLEQIFNLYHQVNPETDEGSGIGLSLTKEFVELHGGQISATSDAQGTNFHIRLPSQKQHRTATDQELTINLNSHQEDENDEHGDSTVLVVDDNQDILDMLNLTLKSDGHRVLTCNDPLEVEQLVANSSPDLIITDLIMPKMNGFELVRQLKTNFDSSHVPILMLTAKSDLKHKIIGLENGADMYLEKPFNEQELLARVRNLIKQREQLRQKYLQPENKLQDLYLSQSQVDHDFLTKVTNLILAEMTNSQFDVQHLCGNLGMSQSALFKKIKGTTGLSISQFIRSVKMNEAVKMMENTSDNFTEIAMKTGFSSLNFFTKCFKQHFEQTPSEYKTSRLSKMAT